MENFYDGTYDSHDPSQYAQDFEQGMRENPNYYMDPSTIEEVFDYYRFTSELDKAERLMRFAIDRFPHISGFYFKKSCLDYERGHYRRSEHEINQAIDLEPANEDFLLQKTRILFRNDRRQAAFALIEEICDLVGDHAESFYELGSICQQHDYFYEAIKFFELALKHDPKDLEDPLYEIIYCYNALGKAEQALTYCKAFVDENPFSSVAWYNLGVLYYENGLFEQAIKAYDYAIVIEETFLSAHFGKGSAMMMLGQYHEALSVLLEGLHHDAADAAMLMAVAECYEELNKPDRARFYYTKVTNYCPGLPEAFLGVAASLEAEERYYEALHHYQKTLKANDGMATAWFGLAQCEYQVGNILSAYEALDRAFELEDTNIDDIRHWALQLSDDNRSDKALEVLARGLQAVPRAVELAYLYAAIAFRVGRSNEAFVILENALMADFDKHKLLYDYCPEIVNIRTIQELITQYRPHV